MRNALAYLGEESEITADVEKIQSASHVILPGVGSFVDGMRNLEERGLVSVLQGIARSGKPLLGICLGMQLLADTGDEGGGAAGLGIIPGVARRLTGGADYRLPHIGWNDVAPKEGARLFAGIKAPVFYFVHSFVLAPQEERATAGTTEYGETFTSAIEEGLVFGVQFHPEKSQHAGLTLLENFLKIRS